MTPSSLRVLARSSLAQWPTCKLAHHPIRQYSQPRAANATTIFCLPSQPRHQPLFPAHCCARNNTVRHYAASRPAPKDPRRRRPKQEREGADRSETPTQRLAEAVSRQDDYGIFPGTAIVLSRTGWPSWIRRPRARSKMEWQYVKIRFTDFVSCVNGKLSKGYSNFFRTSLGRTEVKQVAAALHERMNTAIAEGDLETLEEIALSQLYKQLAASIKNRPSGIDYTWQLTSPQAHTTVITNRASPFPDEKVAGKNAWLRQAVVRVRSAQSLRLRRPQRQEQIGFVPRIVDEVTEVQSGDYDELLVLQKLMKEDGDGEWKIWGTTEETKAKDWERLTNPVVPGTNASVPSAAA